ncbi:hypothetical protein HanIR_Chr01g0000781 [Helianthus annuus]|nr:hypothetical protein HanIR_Chr01g0000781 [Helianthus annuus]
MKNADYTFKRIYNICLFIYVQGHLFRFVCVRLRSVSVHEHVYFLKERTRTRNLVR